MRGAPAVSRLDAITAVNKLYPLPLQSKATLDGKQTAGDDT